LMTRLNDAYSSRIYYVRLEIFSHKNLRMLPSLHRFGDYFDSTFSGVLSRVSICTARSCLLDRYKHMARGLRRYGPDARRSAARRRREVENARLPLTAVIARARQRQQNFR